MSASWLQLQTSGWSALVTIGAGCTLTVVAAWIAARLLTTPPAQRRVWRAAMLVCLLMTVGELTGLTRFASTSWTKQTIEFDVAVGGTAETRPLLDALETIAYLDEPRVDSSEAPTWNWVPSIEPHPSDLTPESDLGAIEPYQEFPVTQETVLPDVEALAAPLVPRLRPPSPWIAAFFVALWGIGIGLFALRHLALSLVRWRFDSRTDAAAESDLQLLQELLREFGIRRRIRLRQSDEIASPVAYGVYRPTIVLAASLPIRFERRQIRAMLSHEVGHVVARDAAWQLGANLLRGLLWWNPFVWQLHRSLGEASEAAADSLATRLPQGGQLLAECLVQLGRELTMPRMGWQSAAGNGYRSNLARRVQALLTTSKSTRTSRLRPVLITCLIAAWLLTSLHCTTWARTTTFSLTEGEREMRTSTALRRSVLAALISLTAAAPGSAQEKKTDPPAAKAAKATAAKQAAQQKAALEKELAAQKKAIARRQAIVIQRAVEREKAVVQQQAAKVTKQATSKKVESKPRKGVYTYRSTLQSKATAAQRADAAKAIEKLQAEIQMLRAKLKATENSARAMDTYAKTKTARRSYQQLQVAKQAQNYATNAAKTAQSTAEKSATYRYPNSQGFLRRYDDKNAAYGYSTGYTSRQLPQATYTWTTQTSVQMAKLKAAYEALTKAGLKDEAASVKKKIDSLMASTRSTRSSSELSKRVDQLSAEVKTVREELAEIKALLKKIAR